MDDLIQLRIHLASVIDTNIGLKFSCRRHNDRDGELYAQGKIDAYSCVIDMISDLLSEDDEYFYDRY